VLEQYFTGGLTSVVIYGGGEWGEGGGGEAGGSVLLRGFIHSGRRPSVD
jgi:hypothetical protein